MARRETVPHAHEMGRVSSVEGGNGGGGRMDALSASETSEGKKTDTPPSPVLSRCSNPPGSTMPAILSSKPGKTPHFSSPCSK